jgi:hypothetical protein
MPMHGASAAGPLSVATGDPAPAAADDDCQFCFAFSHQSAAPIDFVAAPLADHVPLPPLSAAAITQPCPSYFLFRSRAPPQA